MMDTTWVKLLFHLTRPPPPSTPERITTTTTEQRSSSLRCTCTGAHRSHTKLQYRRRLGRSSRLMRTE